MVQLAPSASGNTRMDLAGNHASSTSASVYPGPGDSTSSTGSSPALTLGGGRRGLKAKTLKRMLKKAGLKTSGKKSTLRARAKKAHLVRGGVVGLGVVSATEQGLPVSGGRRRSRRHRHRSYRY